ncbi:MAG: ABC transporter ATP-binding protein, partial [Clostridia bacterium]|nr:ABC transporter ATP-binding protein [Clostridia bacterium]
MLKKLAKCIREYKKLTVLTLCLMVGEAIIETLIPLITAQFLINRLQQHQTDGTPLEMTYIILVGVLLIVMALGSLTCGGLAGLTSARASAGFAKNLRHDIFERIQGFSFENIDRFSSSSLVTRLTTDVSHVQMAFMMIIRTAVRSPLMLIFSVVMSAILGGWLAATFVVVIPVLGVGLVIVSRKAMPAFRRVFKKYDRLN